MDWREDRSDAELLEASDTDAFGALYERHVDDVLRYFGRRTGCAQTSADLTAETFAAALISQRNFRNTGAPARAWLFKIAERQLSRFVRKEAVSQRARNRLGIELSPLSSSDIERIEELIDVGSLAASLSEALGNLPSSQRDALVLRVGEDLPYREVATRLGCTEGAARVRVTRGLRALADGMSVA